MSEKGDEGRFEAVKLNNSVIVPLHLDDDLIDGLVDSYGIDGDGIYQEETFSEFSVSKHLKSNGSSSSPVISNNKFSTEGGDQPLDEDSVMELMKRYAVCIREDRWSGRLKMECILNWWRDIGNDDMPDLDDLERIQRISDRLSSNHEAIAGKRVHSVKATDFTPIFLGHFNGTSVDPTSEQEVDYSQTIIGSMNGLNVSPNLREQIVLLDRRNRSNGVGLCVEPVRGIIEDITKKPNEVHQKELRKLVHKGQDAIRKSESDTNCVSIDKEDFEE